MVLNATYNNISVISWWSVLLLEMHYWDFLFVTHKICLSYKDLCNATLKSIPIVISNQFPFINNFTYRRKAVDISIKSLTLYHIILYRVHLALSRFELTMLGEIIAQVVVNPTTIWSQPLHPLFYLKLRMNKICSCLFSQNIIINWFEIYDIIICGKIPVLYQGYRCLRLTMQRFLQTHLGESGITIF
jgi:hypothetical protein